MDWNISDTPDIIDGAFVRINDKTNIPQPTLWIFFSYIFQTEINYYEIGEETFVASKSLVCISISIMWAGH